MFRRPTKQSAFFFLCVVFRAASYPLFITAAFHPPLVVVTTTSTIVRLSYLVEETRLASTTKHLLENWLDGRTHEFWRKARSRSEVYSHVMQSLAQVDDSFYYSSSSTTTTTMTPNIQVISAEPPLVVIHDFIPKQGCDDIIQAAKDLELGAGLQRSTTGASQQTSSSRTSSTVWLRDESCPGPLRLLAEKFSRISGLPPSYMENLQVCRYEPGQQFKLHTDHQDSFNDLACRGRLATCLIYLAEPTLGGETWFPGITTPNDDKVKNGKDVFVTPKQGSAVFFWNTVEKPGSENYHPEMFLNADLRLRHGGLPVEEGEKWICNRWVHPIDFGSGVVGMEGRVNSRTPSSEPSIRQETV